MKCFLPIGLIIIFFVLYFVLLFTRYFPLKQTHCLNFKFALKGNFILPLSVRDNMYHSLPKIESGCEKYICGAGGPPGPCRQGSEPELSLFSVTK